MHALDADGLALGAGGKRRMHRDAQRAVIRGCRGNAVSGVSRGREEVVVRVARLRCAAYADQEDAEDRQSAEPREPVREGAASLRSEAASGLGEKIHVVGMARSGVPVLSGQTTLRRMPLLECKWEKGLGGRPRWGWRGVALAEARVPGSVHLRLKVGRQARRSDGLRKMPLRLWRDRS